MMIRRVCRVWAGQTVPLQRRQPFLMIQALRSFSMHTASLNNPFSSAKQHEDNDALDDTGVMVDDAGDQTRLATETTEIMVGDPSAGVLLLCEYASSRLPKPWDWHQDDSTLINSPHSTDTGAAALTRQISRATQWPAVMSRFTRMLCDPNQEESRLRFPFAISGVPLALNAKLDDSETSRRIEQVHRPFMSSILAVSAEMSSPKAIISIRTFIPHKSGADDEVPDVILHPICEVSRACCDAIASDMCEWGYIVLVAPDNHMFSSGARLYDRPVYTSRDGQLFNSSDANVGYDDLRIVRLLAKGEEGEGSDLKIWGVSNEQTQQEQQGQGQGHDQDQQSGEQTKAQPARGIVGMCVEVRADAVRDESWRNSLEEVLRVAVWDTVID
eukprot:c3623_g1_i1.p1 GENE.c3623_g1_i1~~c3623_g1_i1.p1  ORF type:complete len:386 (+),score=77.61 c3623_g1_i1:48-1205(+)